MTTTTTLRSWWAPACEGPFSRVGLYGSGWVTVRSPTVPAVVALNSCLMAWRYITRRDDTGAYNCRRITGGTGYSLHAYGTAIDLNWQSNPYGSRLITDMPFGMVQAIKAIRTKNGKQVWRWGGDYRGNKDAMHFEIVCHPNDLATGINPSTLPGAQQEDEMTPEQMAEVKQHIEDTVKWWGTALSEKIDDIAERQVPKATTVEGLRNIKRIGHKLEIGTIEGGNPDEVG